MIKFSRIFAVTLIFVSLFCFAYAGDDHAPKPKSIGGPQPLILSIDNNIMSQ